MPGRGSGLDQAPSGSRPARADQVRSAGAVGVLYRSLTALGAAGGRLSHAAAAVAPQRTGRENLSERLGLAASLVGLPERPIWIHAASVGEVRSVAPLAAELGRAASGVPILVTTSTTTGRRVARDELRLPSRLAPWDSSGPVGRFIDAVRPRLHISVETELWPVRLELLARRGVPSALVGARLSEQRWPLYRRLSGLFAPALSSFALVSPLATEDRNRLLALGVSEAVMRAGGSLKWDAAPEPPPASESEHLRSELGLEPGIGWVVLGSVHPGEAGPLAAALLAAAPAAGVVVAPRHPRRFDDVAGELARTGHAVHRASAGRRRPDARIVLLDRMGALPRLYPLAATAVVGGTFVNVGGHSPLEAAAAACPLVAGPFVHKQRELIEPLAAADALVRVDGPAEAAAALSTWLADPAERRRRGDAARAEIDRRRGLAARLARELAELLR